jgi:5-(carboxyamino)imidazole ribonucleotide synthase
VRAPAAVPAQVARAAEELARAAVQAVSGNGITAVELFERMDGAVVINELAPRPHNSGHFSIEAAVCSQFENHVRAVLGLPLGATALRTAAAVMVNLLGTRNGPLEVRGLDAALALPDVHVHIYGKAESRTGRKLGHVTALGPTVEDAEARARAAAAAISL